MGGCCHNTPTLQQSSHSEICSTTAPLAPSQPLTNRDLLASQQRASQTRQSAAQYNFQEIQMSKYLVAMVTLRAGLDFFFCRFPNPFCQHSRSTVPRTPPGASSQDCRAASAPSAQNSPTLSSPRHSRCQLWILHPSHHLSLPRCPSRLTGELCSHQT